jgi:hypothetical protein
MIATSTVNFTGSPHLNVRVKRPEPSTESAHFLGHYFPGEPPTPYDVLVFTRDNGTEKEIYRMLHEAMQAWERELSRLEIRTTPRSSSAYCCLAPPAAAWRCGG